MGKMKIIYFSETVAAYDPQVGRCIDLNDHLNLHAYQRLRSFLDLRQRSVGFKLIFFFSKTIESFETKYYVIDFGSIEMKIYTNGLCQMTKMAATTIHCKKTLKIFSLEPVSRLQ